MAHLTPRQHSRMMIFASIVLFFFIPASHAQTTADCALAEDVLNLNLAQCLKFATPSNPLGAATCECVDRRGDFVSFAVLCYPFIPSDVNSVLSQWSSFCG
ncbi:hypothetical protein HK096_000390, partial [Nowakowskiella sp. JEL0078]